jgi:hypothetical protein
MAISTSEKQLPWYKRARRWGQTNLTEMDPIHCDLDFWKDFWRQTRVQGVIVNAGGIVAYYPSALGLQYRAKGLGEKDFFGEFTAAARESGLSVIARMDINRATEDFYKEHPDWFAVDAEGNPYIVGDRYSSCVNSDYYKKFIPEVLQEIITRYHPDGFADNNWKGIKRSLICYCDNCKKKFCAYSGFNLPEKEDWDDPVYKTWIKWSYLCRMENWDLFNQVTRRWGGEDCLWLGMVNANPINASFNFCDLYEIGKRSDMILCDHQSRDSINGFEQNSINGDLLHDISSWEQIIPESMSSHVRGARTFRRTSNPLPETRMWMYSGMAGGISPWYHIVGAVQEDRRLFKPAVAAMQWHEKNEAYLYNRIPVANVGLVWSQENIDFYGQNLAQINVGLPWRGFTHALTRARIPFLPVNANHIPEIKGDINVLILPELAVMTDSQICALRSFVESGGSLILTGASGTLDEWGVRREQFPLESVAGIRHLGTAEGAPRIIKENWEHYEAHNYLRIEQHESPVFAGLEETDILPFGGELQNVEPLGFMQTAATYIPEFPIVPPELSWMRQPSTDKPAIAAGVHPAGGRIVYFAGDIDRCYGSSQIPDHGDLLANAVRWSSSEDIPVKISGPGYLCCKLYRQENRMILHILNLSGANGFPDYLEENFPVGPLHICIKTGGLPIKTAVLRVAGKEFPTENRDGWASFVLDCLVDHEMILFE